MSRKRRHANESAASFLRGCLTRRSNELASAKARALTDPLAEWVLREIRLDGRPFSFEGHEHLRALYDETAQHIVVSKAAQVGGTTWALFRSFHACMKGLDVIQYMPTRAQAEDFSRSRVAPLIEENPVLAEMIHDTDTIGLKRIGDACLHILGMKSISSIKSTPADMIVLDELDEVDPEAKAMAMERLSHSEFKCVIELSNPSLPNYGIDESYQLSDQRHWLIKCHSCNHWNCLDKEFPTTIGQEVRIILPRPDGTCYRACVKCSAELDLAHGEWVADFPDIPIHGYRISQLFSPRVDPREILRSYQKTRYRDRFYNLKIGIPYADLDRRLDMMTVLSLCTQAPMLEACEDPCTMGVDVGNELHVVVLKPDDDVEDKQHLVHLARCQEPDLDDLMHRFNVERCVIDGLPEPRMARAFAQRFPGRVYLSFFNEHQRGAPHWNPRERKLEVNRTEALDTSRAAVREKLLVLPRREPLVELFAKHMTADAKKLDENEETGARKYRYLRTGDNDFSMALTYALLAALDKSGARAMALSLRRWRKQHKK